MYMYACYCQLLYEEVDLKRYWIKIANNQIYLASSTPVHYNLIIFNSGNRFRQKNELELNLDLWIKNFLSSLPPVRDS